MANCPKKPFCLLRPRSFLTCLIFKQCPSNVYVAMDVASVTKRIERFIRRKVGQAGARGAVLGLSGGLDSAVVAVLCARALGPDNVMALIMPSSVSRHSDVEDAKTLAASLGIHRKVIPIDPILRAFMEHLTHDRMAIGNLMARIRMCLLYYHANHVNYLVVGTGNKSELSVGYFTKYGDGGCDILPIGDVYKTQVRRLARHLGVPEKIVKKEPSAGLWGGQTDEKDLGVTYKRLDMVLQGRASSRRIMEMVRASRHKRRPPEVCRL